MYSNNSDTLEQRAAQFGIPMKLTVDHDLRYSYCSAFMADLVSIDGTTATYAGECANQHQYRQQFEIEELKKMSHIENGELVFGGKKGFKATDLEEY